MQAALMEIHLTNEEAASLRIALDLVEDEITGKIINTDNMKWRAKLRERRSALDCVRRQLGQAGFPESANDRLNGSPDDLSTCVG